MNQAVAGIVFYKDKVLIGKKIIKEGHFVSGGWHIPGGGVLEHEDIEQALKREIKEETNLDIEIIKKITIKYLPVTDAEVHWYLCKTDSNKCRPGDDLEEIKFVSKDKVLEECDIRAIKLWPRKILDIFKASKSA